MTLASRRVLVIGATGPCGEIFAELALQEGHVVTLYLRNEAKLKPHLRARCNVHVGQLQDEGKLADALSTGIDAIISFAGPPTTWRAPLNTGTPITEGYRVLFSVMRKAGIRRALILSDACYTVPDDRVTLKWRLGAYGVRLVGGSGYTDLTSASALTAAQEDLDWTIFRVPYLTNGATLPVHAGYLGDAQDGSLLSRASLARWVLDELVSPEWTQRAPKVSHASSSREDAALVSHKETR